MAVNRANVYVFVSFATFMLVSLLIIKFWSKRMIVYVLYSSLSRRIWKKGVEILSVFDQNTDPVYLKKIRS